MKQQYGFDTLVTRGGYSPDKEFGSIVPPIHQTTAYEFHSTEHAQSLFNLSDVGHIYSRLNNPTVDALEARMAALDGGIGALAFASGHAAIFSTMINLANAGDEIVSSLFIYGGAINLLGVTLGNLGIKVKFVSGHTAADWEAQITDKTKALFVEGVGNPNANVADLEMLSGIAKKHGIPLIVDSTFTTPYLQRPIEWGADIVIHSATKFLGGSGNSMCGVVVDCGTFDFAGNPRFPAYNNPDPSYHGLVFAKDCGKAAFITRLRTLMMRDIGACLSPFNAFLILTGIDSLSVRMERHCKNALEVAKWLEKRKGVSAVNFPGLSSSPDYKLAEKYLPKGVGSVFTFELEGGREAGGKFIDSLELFLHVANVGDARSLVIHPATTTHSQLTDEQLKNAGIGPGTVRLSIGIEDINDIIADLDQAITKAQA